MLTSTTFGQYLTPGQAKIFYDEFKAVKAQYEELFRTIKSKRATESIWHVGGFGLWSVNTEGAAITTEDIKQAAGAVIAPKRYDKGYTISWELMQDDPYGVFNGTAGKNGSAKTLGSSLRATVETAAAAVLSNGFTANGYDNKPLFSSTHKYNVNTGTPPTGSNVLEADLTDEGLKEACKMMRAQKDNSGIAPCGAIPDKLIVHPDSEFTARMILNSGVNFNGTVYEKNSLPNLKIVVMDYLADDTAWFVKARDIDNLLFIWREEPIFNSHGIEKSMDWFFYGYARFAANYGDWRGLVGVQVPEPQS
ncbi:MAG: Mu-like prophage major head subunit gpT family protein [Clostridiales bacterium]|jgi:phage major head subunit gpT-like protein|nr:Mu-like prophage major head subunit gpT family protein [Clostridiales bacterium]